MPALLNEFSYGDQPGLYTLTAADDGRIVKLEDVFDAIPNVLYSIDLKFSDATKVDLVYRVIASRNMERRVVWGSKYDAVHARAIEVDPSIALYFREAAFRSTFNRFLLGILWLYPLEADVLSAPIMTSEQVEVEKWLKE